MKTKDLCRRLISLMQVIHLKGKEKDFYAYKNKDKDFVFGWKGKSPNQNTLSKGMAIYLVMKGK